METMLENEPYFLYGGSFAVSVCILTVIIFVSRRRWKTVALTKNNRKSNGSPKRILFQRKVDNSEWINKLLASVLAKETQSEAAYHRLWLSALNELALRAQSGSEKVLYSHVEFSDCAPELSNITVAKTSTDTFKFGAHVHIKRILLSGSVKSEFSENDTVFSSIISDLAGEISIAWIRGNETLKLNAAFVTPPNVNVIVKFSSTCYSTSNVNDVGAVIKGHISDTTLDIPVFQSSQSVMKGVQMRNRVSAAYSRRISSRMFDVSQFHCCAVRILRASCLCEAEYETMCAYCVVDVDRPSKKFSTSSVLDTKHPFWDEKFFFQITDDTTEIRLEVFDRTKSVAENFVGRAVLDFDDIETSACSEYTLPLLGPRGVIFSHNPTVTFMVELIDHLPTLSDFALRMARGQNVILETEEDKFGDEEADLSGDIDDVDFAGPGEISLLSNELSTIADDSRNNTLSREKKKSKGLKHALKKRFSFNTHTSVKVNQLSPPSLSKQLAEDLRRDAVKGDSGSGGHKSKFANGLHNLLHRKHKSNKKGANGSLGDEATILENDGCASIADEKKQGRVGVTNAGDANNTLPRVKKNK